MPNPVIDHVDLIAEYVPLVGCRAVDVGCGKGVLVRQLAARGAMMTGIEITAEKLAAARDLPVVADEIYCDGRAEALPFPDASLDLAVFLFSLHHVPEAVHRDALAEVHRVLVPGGHLCIGEPLAEGPFFELLLPVHDETAVRAAAQRTVALAPSLGFAAVATRLYSRPRAFRDFAELKAHVLGVDPARTPAFAAHEAALEDAFHHMAERVDGRFVLDQPCRMDVLRRV
ncbi:class I SAM-dependent methyltransferase [Azospirillum halopraeferens]|uniref:class I SAM-dependent methyltransferase n=1 Tax=Azospirillum halopraeferens TaxID=34010 RepID=UPI000411BDA1|nr:class I SAM-dependent methyltransferase [Azospirillum halopraeferens]